MRAFALAAALLCGPAAPSVATPPPGGVPHAAPPARVEAVSFDRDGRTATVRVHLSSPVEAFSADARAGRLEIVLDGARPAPALRQGGAEWPVQSYRVEAEGDRVVLSFRIEGGVAVRATADAGSDDVILSFSDGAAGGARVAGWGAARSARQPERARPQAGRATRSAAGWRPAADPVRPDLPANAAPARTPAARPSPRPAPRAEPPRRQPPRPAAPAPRPMPTVDPAPTQPRPAPPVASGALEAQAPDVDLPDASRWQLDTVVLDAGHGGQDHGAVGHGTSDKEVAWGVVSRLGPMIERELGVRVVYTRDDDTFVELRERGRIANRSNGKLFISVHANAAGSSSASGTETFFLAPHRESSAKDVMDRENSVIELESQPELYEDFDDQGDILQAMAMSAYQEESQTLAGLIEREFVASGRSSRGVKQAGFIVLWAASMPAVLVETGFVTNPGDARLLSSDAGLDATAEAIFRAVRAYKERYERGLHPQHGG
ncbi:N-acetylmuramoyl-L-alanine amidase [Rubrivirga sp. S365]|uniref:N-acetylmuramoyl-L-alanine amidase family protein n=1 Tax=Rubrivirga sp. S365 TaxID=3076080 RepID=UPI0028C6F060|nr:N-acetylmuramoyl-L-alanine amidase [Rubrivirga sp. S365]MDT7855078.1 N-acetylmuramoyl-L-alanine amidase [Rubrivirga sp. S365]